MSLVFLKNKDTTSIKNGRTQKPYRFSNFFTHPIKLPPNSQVALVNASFTVDSDLVLDSDMPIYALTGEPVLNMPYKVKLPDDAYINDWTQFFNELGVEITELNPDSNYMYVKTDNGVVQPPQNTTPPLNPESRQQGVTPTGGMNWILQNSKKSLIQVTQQADLMNDVFFQNFTPVYRPQTNMTASTQPIDVGGPILYENFTKKINSNNIDGQATPPGPNPDPNSILIQSSDERVQHIALGDYSPYNSNGWSPRYPGGVDFTFGTAMPNNPQNTSWGNTPSDSSYYNTQFLFNRTLYNDALNSTEPISSFAKLFPGSLGISKDYGWNGQFNKCGIKRAVGSTKPNGAVNGYANGHPHIGANDSGGYVVMGLETRDWVEASSIYNAGDMGSNDLTGSIGSAPSFYGVLPSAMIYDREDADGVSLGSTDSIKDFLENVDLNIGDDNDPDGMIPNREGFDRNNAEARYMFGCKLYFTPNQSAKIYLQAQALKPNIDGGSLDQSIYTNINQPLNITALSQGRNTACDPHFDFQPAWGINQSLGPRKINVFNHPGGRDNVLLFLRFRWDSPYTMVCEFILSDLNQHPNSYNPATDEPYLPWDDPANPAGNKNPLAGWCKLASMKNPLNGDGSVPQKYERLIIPTSYGDIVPVSYHTYEGSFSAWKGYFNNLQSGFSRDPDSLNNQTLRGFRDRSYWKQTTPGFNLGMGGHSTLVLTENTASRTTPALTQAEITEFTDLEGFDADGRIEKTQHLLCVETQTDEDLDYWLYSNGNQRFADGEPTGLAHGLAWGLQSALTNIEATLEFEIDGTATDYQMLQYTGIGPYINNTEIFSNHIQITNLPIQSANGVRSTQNKTIYNIPVFQDDQNQNVVDGLITNSYAFTPPNLIWVDLNNYQEIDLNKIDILITDDNNEEQESLSGKTDLTLIFRQKGAGDAGYLPINIPTEEPEIRKRIKAETKKNLIEL